MTIDTNKAWDKLYTRLQDDRLLIPEGKKRLSLIAKTGWAAAIMLAATFGALSIYLFTAREPVLLSTITNPDINTTLVSTLNDGSVVYLSGGATLSYPENFSGAKRQVILEGGALFEIQSDKDHPFLIETESVMVEVLGTAFSISSSGKEQFNLSVQQGSVQVTLKSTGKPVFVEAGESVHLNADVLSKTHSENGRHFGQYREKMHFKDERLCDIIGVINKLSVKPIAFSDPSAGNKSVTITFSNNTPSEMIDLLCMAFGMKYTEDADTIIIDRQ